MADRLIRKIDRSGGQDACWPWTGRVNEHGYGQMSIPGGMKMVHRLVYEIANGPIPEGKYVCHSCDNPPCCNPRHLFAGSAKDNSMDMARKERSGQTKLTKADIIAIRSDPRPTKEIGAQYGIHWGNVAAIKSGRTWTYLPGAVAPKKKAKIGPDQVRAIRRDPRVHHLISADYGISVQQVGKIKKRERWTSVAD